MPYVYVISVIGFIDAAVQVRNTNQAKKKREKNKRNISCMSWD